MNETIGGIYTFLRAKSGPRRDAAVKALLAEMEQGLDLGGGPQPSHPSLDFTMWRIILIITLAAGCGCGEQSEKSVPASAPAAVLATGGFERSEIITLTPVAAQKIREMSEDLDVTTTAYLRVGVKPAKAPEFHYLLDITEAADPKNDLLGNSQGIQIVVDRKASIYLIGTRIDYRTTDSGSGFWFDNPNAQSQPSGDAR